MGTDSGRVSLKVEEILERRHELLVGFVEPWPALGPEGNELLSHVEVRMSVNDAVNHTRKIWADQGIEHRGKDRELIQDFLSIHWAVVIDPDKEKGVTVVDRPHAAIVARGAHERVFNYDGLSICVACGSKWGVGAEADNPPALCDRSTRSRILAAEAMIRAARELLSIPADELRKYPDGH